MKLLKIQASGLEIFKDPVEISFFAQQRVADDEKEQLYPLFSNIYMNTAIGLIGINASGKTSALKLVFLALRILGSKPINSAESKGILGTAKKAVITNYLFDENSRIIKLETEIGSEESFDGVHYYIRKESLWEKKTNTVKTKKSLFDFDGISPTIVRDPDERFLSRDVSIIISLNRDSNAVPVYNFLSFTDMNYIPAYFPAPEYVLNYLDPTIESITVSGKGEKSQVKLKFKGKPIITLPDTISLNQYISSGTVKGMILFVLALKAIKEGGYLLIDEIENHFNREIVATLLRLFMDHTINKNGGVIIYSTHYPELLDIYDRNDSIYITKNVDGITLENMSKLLDRNDIKKSDAYQSSLLGGTAPSYDAYIKLRNEFVHFTR